MDRFQDGNGRLTGPPSLVLLDLDGRWPASGSVSGSPACAVCAWVPADGTPSVSWESHDPRGRQGGRTQDTTHSNPSHRSSNRSSGQTRDEKGGTPGSSSQDATDKVQARKNKSEASRERPLDHALILSYLAHHVRRVLVRSFEMARKEGVGQVQATRVVASSVRCEDAVVNDGPPGHQ
jgi:hypothetical protein